jgi:hypothetical protein
MVSSTGTTTRAQPSTVSSINAFSVAWLHG